MPKPINRRGVGSILKACSHDWKRCACTWTIRYRGLDKRQHEETGYPNQTRAWGRLSQLKDAKSDPGKRRATTPERFGPYADTWLSRRRALAPGTVSMYERLIRLHLKPELEYRLMSDITIKTIYSLVDTLEQAGLAPRHIALIYDNTLIPIIRSAVVEKMIPPLDLSGVELPPVDEAEEYCPTPEEVRALLSGVDPRYQLGIGLMAGCGLRVAEAVAVNDVCFEQAGTIRICEQWTERRTLGPLKHRRKGQYRLAPLPQFVEDLREEHRRRYPMTEDGYYFPGHGSKLIKTYTLNWQMKQVIKHHNDDEALPNMSEEITPHSLRHFFGTHAVLDGEADITEVARWLGHRNINITFGIYGHLVETRLAESRAVMDRALGFS